MEPYIGEIKMFAGNFAPAGWKFCDGSLLDISAFDTLFNLIGTTYGGDGQSTFALPDLRGRVPVHEGPQYQLGMNGGAENVTLLTAQLPTHTHPMYATTNFSTQTSPAGNVLAQSTVAELFSALPANSTLHPATITSSGGGNQPHYNLQPYLCVTFIIATDGIYPPQS